MNQIIGLLISLMLQQEPDLLDPKCVSIEPLSNGLVQANYDLNGNGKIDYWTLRIVKQTFETKIESHKDLLALAENWEGYRVLYVHEDRDIYFIYIVYKHPLFYVTDVNEDGKVDVIYKDSDTDDINGNEELYEGELPVDSNFETEKIL
jgi:hypothetical protein